MTEKKLVDMTWDPVTRVIGSLGIHTRIDFESREVAECRSTSSIFRGYSVFRKGKDPRDAHFITSRICGICGDNHATCAVYAQNMAFGVKPPHLAEWIVNCGEAAEYMFDHNLFQDNLVGVDFCERMVRETNPAVLARAETTLAPHGDVHGHRTVAEIMRALNPFEGSLYKEALHMSRLAREMFCLMEGRHVHPSTLYPGGVGTVPSPQLFSEYLVRLSKYVEFVKRMVPLHDDLFDFFYEALPGYEAVGQRRVLLAFDTGGGPLARLWATALAGRVRFGSIEAHEGKIKIGLPSTANLPEVELEWRIPRWANTLERDRARTYFQAYAAAAALFFAEQALQEVYAGRTATWSPFSVPDEAIGCGFHEAVRGALSHHLVIRDGKIANYHPYPPTVWNASPRDSFGTPGPYEDAVQNTPLFEENPPDSFKGIDIMRTVRSFDPCLPCGVHMYLGDGRVLQTRHSPTLGLRA